MIPNKPADLLRGCDFSLAALKMKEKSRSYSKYITRPRAGGSRGGGQGLSGAGRGSPGCWFRSPVWRVWPGPRVGSCRGPDGVTL